MTPNLLIEHFDRISDAPDAVVQLRGFILDLAVRGKLVEQDREDEPASVLLNRIQTEKTLGIQNGRMKVQTKLHRIREDEAPFPIPRTWIWLRLIDLVVKLTDGTHHSPINIEEGAFKYVTAKNIKPRGVSLADISYVTAEVHEEIYARCDPVKGDILYIKDGATTGIVTINDLDEPFSMLSSVALLKPSREIYNRLLVEFLRSPFFYSQMRGFMKGAAITRVTLKRMSPALVPLPPVAEQHRIVAKVDELMALCDRLESAQAERNGRRQTLVSAANHHMANGDDPEAFRQNASFYFNNLPRLTACGEHIEISRQTILNLAIRGQLVPQNSNDIPASRLLEHIHLEKLGLVNKGELKKYDLTQSPKPSQFTFPLPFGWAPATLQQLCLSVTDGDHLPPPKTDEGVPFLVIGNVRTQVIEFAGCRYVSEEYYKALDPIRCPRKGDILYTLVGSYGIPIIVTDDRQFCVQRHIGILRPSPLLNLKFLHRVLESDWVFRQATAIATGIAQKTVPLAGLRKILVPLPPLAEQGRIVARVDKLMDLCDKLESRVTSDSQYSLRLLEAVLSDALHSDQPTRNSDAVI